jgi:hypothetical protein
MTDDLDATRELLSRQVTEAVATDPLGAVSSISAIQKEAEEHLRVAVRAAAASSSWQEIAGALGVSKQAAHQRFRTYAKGVANEMRTQQLTMKLARHQGNAEQAAQAQARRAELAMELHAAARELKHRR